MFICEDCFGIGYGHSPPMLCKSYGPCEACGLTQICDDYPSKYLPDNFQMDSDWVWLWRYFIRDEKKKCPGLFNKKGKNE